VTNKINSIAFGRYSDARAKNPRDLTLCLAMTNEAAVNIAVTLFKMGVKYMQLCMCERVLALGKKDLEGLEMLKDEKRVKTKDIPRSSVCTLTTPKSDKPRLIFLM